MIYYNIERSIILGKREGHKEESICFRRHKEEDTYVLEEVYSFKCPF
jgi:hypothetical protein